MATVKLRVLGLVEVNAISGSEKDSQSSGKKSPHLQTLSPSTYLVLKHAFGVGSVPQGPQKGKDKKVGMSYVINNS